MSPTILKNAQAVETELRALVLQELNLYQIARTLDISPATARRYMSHLKIKPFGKRKKRNNKPDHRIEEMVKMRKNGQTLDEIGTFFNITRERVRQILQKQCPDFVFPIRIVKSQTCNHCGVSYVPSGPGSQFCNQKCMGVARNLTFNRDTAIKVMRQRDQGKKWSEVANELGQGASNVVFRARIQRYKHFFSSTEQELYFPSKNEKQFKANSANELEENETKVKGHDSLITKMLLPLFNLIRLPSHAKSPVESNPQGTAHRKRQP